MNGRISRLEGELGLGGPPKCPLNCVPGAVFFTEEYVNPADQLVYCEPPPPAPCSSCGSRPFVIYAGCVQPMTKPPGAPEASAVMMDHLASADWHERRGRPDLAAWFRGRAGHAPNHPMSTFKGPTR